MLEVKNLTVHFLDAAPDRNAVDGVSFAVNDGEIVGLVGESGSGKTVTAMAISGLLPRRKSTYTGEVILDGEEILHCDRNRMREFQGETIGVIFQEPMTAFDPLMKVGRQVEEALWVHHPEMSAEARRSAALNAMAEVELDEPELVYDKYPHELSGGMLQRAMIAAAIIHSPKLLLADEPTTALDVTIQAQILKLLKKINKSKGMSVLFISHNMQVVRKLSERVLVMHRGKIVEEGTVDQVFLHPQDPYTRHLIASIPSRDRHLRDLARLHCKEEKTMLKNVKVLEHSAIRIEGEKTVYFDPFHVKEAPHDADVIFITHEHYDHLSAEDIEKVAGDKTLFVLPESCREAALKAGLDEKRLVLMRPGETKEINGLPAEAVRAYNVNKQFHTKERSWLGYEVTLGGIRYYVAGDTDDNEDVRRVRCDVALFPVGGTYTTTAEEAAAAVNAILPKAAIPTHYGDIVGKAEDAERFAALLAPEILCELCRQAEK